MEATAYRGGFLSLLKKRNFLFLWLAQIISMTVFYAANYAMIVIIGDRTGSTTLVGLAIICFSLPAVFFGAPAGVFVDRMDKRRVLWMSNGLRALATFLFVLSLIFFPSPLLPLYLLTVLISTISQFFTPAEGSAIPMLVNDEELMPALSLFNITFMLANALGFLLLGPLLLSFLPQIVIPGIQVPFTAVEQLYVLIAVLYVVCAVLILLIPKEVFVVKTPQKNTAAEVGAQTLNIWSSVWVETKQGWSFVRRSKPLFLAVVQLSFAGILIFIIGELATPIVTQLLGLQATAMAFVFAPAGIGLVLGSIFTPRITPRLGKARTIMIGIIALTIVAPLLPLSTVIARFLQPNGWVGHPLLLVTIALLMFIAGIAIDLINIPAQTAMQEFSPYYIKGRVLALQLVLYNAFSIPILLFIGAVSDLFGLDRVLYLLAFIVAGFGIWGSSYERKYHIQEQKPNEEEAAKEEEPARVPSSHS